MKLATFKTFKKIMARTISENDHEALEALRAANRLIKQEGLTWERVLDRSINVIAEFEAAPDEVHSGNPYRAGAEKSSQRQWELDSSLLAEAEQKASSMRNLSKRSRSFVESICSQFEEKGFISASQRDAIKEFVES